MNLICDCLRKHLNGGNCDCFDNIDLTKKKNECEWEDEDEDDEKKTYEKPHKKQGRITTDWDDFLQ